MLRLSVQNTLRLKIAQWSPEKQEQFLQIFRKKFQRGSSEDRLIALDMLRLLDERVPIDVFLLALNDDVTTIRFTALECLRMHGQQCAIFPIEPLINLLSDPEALFRWSSLLAIDTQGEVCPLIC